MTTTLRSRLNLRDKVDIISMYDNNQCSEQEICRKYQIDRVHFYKIISRKEEYLSQYSKAPIKNSVNMEVNNRVWDWYVESKANNISVNGPMIQNQARKIAKQLGFDGFRASNGWLQCFKMRHNIRFSGPPAHKREPNQFLVGAKEISELLMKTTPHWPSKVNNNLNKTFPPMDGGRSINSTAKVSMPVAAAEYETIEIIESDGDEEEEECSMEGGDIDEDEGNDIKDEISFEDEVISERQYDTPLRQDVEAGAEGVHNDVCRNYQDVLDYVHRLQCFSVAIGDSKLLEMSTEMRNHVERTIYGIEN